MSRAKLGVSLWGTVPVADLARQAKQAEDIGCDSVWVIDSQLLCRDVYLTLAACLGQTSTLRVATGVTQPATRHASVTAGAFATLAEMSNGRAVMGIGTGFSSLRTIGLPAAKIAEVERYVTTVRQLLRGEAAAFDNGVSGRITWLEQPANVPVVVAASGPRMTRAAVRFADGVILHQGLSPDLLGRALGWAREGAATLPEISCWVPYSMADDPHEARERVRARVAGALMNTNPDWFEGADREAVLKLQHSYDVSDHATAQPDHAALVTDSLIARYAVAGTPDEVREQLARVMAQPGIDRVILTPQVSGAGALPIEQVLRDLEAKVLRRM
ncbi:MAG: LLM class flavin-dependent oxidoreductase [Acetobacteraceae bacterium]